MTKEEIKEQLKREDLSSEERIYLEARLISLIKIELKDTNNPMLKEQLRLEYYDELKKYKEMIQTIEPNEYKKIPIAKKLGLKIKEIANTIEIYSLKHDVINKVKKAGVSTVFSSLMALGIEVGLTALTGPIAIPTLATIIPIASYMGLSSLLHIPFQKSNWQQLLESYENSEVEKEKIKKFFEENILNNQEYLIAIKELERKDLSTDQKIALYKKIINSQQVILEKAEKEDFKYTIQKDLVHNMNMLRSLYEEKKKDYINDRIQMSNTEFIKLEKDSLLLDKEIFLKSNYIKETAESAAKKTITDTGIMYLARLGLSAVFPQYGFEMASDLLTPFIVSVLNNTFTLADIRDRIKLKESRYVNQFIRFNNREAIDRLMRKENERKIVLNRELV